MEEKKNEGEKDSIKIKSKKKGMKEGKLDELMIESST